MSEESRLPSDVMAIIDLALAEDVGPGDWTTLWTVAAGTRAAAVIVAKSAGVIAGLEVARAVFARVDKDLSVDLLVRDGARVAPGQQILSVGGSARSILTAERVALNFLQRLSGVATVTSEYAAAIEGTGAKVLDTRKTTPGMRRLEKAAVVAGGGANHRFGLHDMVLIKENHIAAAGGIAASLEAVAAQNGSGLQVEIEVTSLDELRQALHAGARRVLLDNMTVVTLREAVQLVRATAPGVETEASGGVSLRTIRQIAETGVDYISVGALTHSAPSMDLSLLLSGR